ncbi:rhomboid family intramembrane serine protease [Thiohalophilus thiocyanatoxydans]|uniref:Membrane associated rhomboid family serine protease n=1 Tax=Thiohalophilus thiocyanatoxydans TaxID=381308 RepID=A0A4R8IQ77_9GAMM|nr:rhomboid family intramembrane serine protease [Thiohalophilus thiocyanatoxydans]TDX99608.1 membrane associated rhomboid family serine protease [Thiohalophilus thiocyanatoxydans]
MFIPLDRKPEWRNPPVITLLLLVINVLCFTLWQGEDQRLEEQAYDYYLDSRLPAIELPLYRKFLSEQGFEAQLEQQEDDDILLSRLLTDGKFQQLMKGGQLINPQHPDYATWQEQRRIFEDYLQRIVTYQYSFKTAEPSLTTLITHMFLHADWGHLIGNMIFLFLVGFSVEMTLGRTLYLSAYLIAGASSGLFYLWLDPDSLMWGIGASGAISGLMGMYTVLFGRRKIRFFYTLLFYFDFVRAPAIILLPIWLGYEVITQIYSPSNINNFAHIGGLLSGALIGYIALRYGKADLDYLDREENKQAYLKGYQQGLEHVAHMEFDKARRIFLELREKHPEKIEITEQLFNIAKLSSDEAIHEYARELLDPDNSRTMPVRQLRDIFIAYVEQVQPNVRLGPDQLISIALRLSSGNYLQDAEKIILYLTTRKSDFARNPEGLLALASQYNRNNNHKKAEKYFNILLQCYPDSREAEHARQVLG